MPQAAGGGKERRAVVPPGRRPVAAARGCCSCKLHPKMFYKQDEEGWECQGCKELTHVPEFGAALSLCEYLNLLACLCAGAADAWQQQHIPRCSPQGAAPQGALALVLQLNRSLSCAAIRKP